MGSIKFSYHFTWYNFHNLGFAQTKETLYKYLLFDKTDIFLQLTNTFGTRTVQIHLGTFFGNPEDIKITGKLAEQYPLELEHGYLLDIISFNWNSFILNLREMPLVLPLSITLTGFNRILIRKIFKSTNGMFKIIACNKANCNLTILQLYTKIQNLPTIPNKRRPTKPFRLHLTEPMYMDMTTNTPKTPQPTNITIQQLFNQSCVPIDSINFQMEQNWTEAVPAFLLAKWEIIQEVLTWIEEHHSQRLKEDPLYKKLVRHVLLLKDHLAVEQEVDNHIQTLFRILAIHYEDGKEEKDFDAGIRIILHVKAIQTILQEKSI